jgi:putative ABC transport system substrate-binding protein
VLKARAREDIDHAFTQLTQERADALLISADPLFNSSREQLAALAIRHTLPAMFNSREFALAGGLLSYGPDQADVFREAGIYVGRILGGEKPSELPVRSAYQVRARYQHQDGEIARSQRSPVATRPR